MNRADPSRDPSVRLHRYRLRWWLVGGYVVAGLGIVLVLLSDRAVVTVIGAVALVFGSLAVVSSTVAAIARRELRRHSRTVSDTAARRMIELLPPRQVAELLLDRVYGPSDANGDVVTALLGGEGLSVDGSDLTISDYTEIDYRLSRVDRQHYRLVLEQRYEFRHRVPTNRFVIFATSDPILRDTIVSGCRLPLFELWFVQDDPHDALFEESVEAIRATVMLGMQYYDDAGVDRKVSLRHPEDHLREVKLQDWGRYLTFFRTDLVGQPTTDRRRYMGKLRIFEVDLHVLAEPHTTVTEIRSLTVRSTTLQLFDNRFCFWQPPFPCFVRRMQFDVSTLPLEGEPELLYRLKPFSLGTRDSPLGWSSAEDVKELPMDGWALPGHGVTLMWRPAE